MKRGICIQSDTALYLIGYNRPFHVEGCEKSRPRTKSKGSSAAFSVRCRALVIACTFRAPTVRRPYLWKSASWRSWGWAGEIVDPIEQALISLPLESLGLWSSVCE